MLLKRCAMLTHSLDPDEYWIEIIQNEGMKKRADW